LRTFLRNEVEILKKRRAGLQLAGLALLAVCVAACHGKAAAVTEPDSGPAGRADAAATPEFVQVPASELPKDAPRPADGPATLPAGAYRVAVEDVLEISVYGDTELTRLVPVRPDGKISFTFIGDVEAAGRSIEEIRHELTERLASFLRAPQVTVIAREFGRQKVYVGGEVKVPGIVYITPRENSLADVLFKSGLTTDRADLAKAVLVRQGRLVDVDFARMIHGDISVNVAVQNGDLVYVPEAAERYIYVVGEVHTQSAVETTIPLSILNVLTRAGGVVPETAKSREIAVLRGGLKDPKVAVVNFRRLVEGDFSQNIMVRPGDVVYVPTTVLGRYNQFIEQVLRTLTFLFQGRVVQQGFR